MPREVSPADAALVRELQTRGVQDPSARRIERARQAGLLDSAQAGLGYGRGSKSNRDDDEADRAVEAFALLAQHATHRTAFLAMFINGDYPVSPEQVKRHLIGALSDLGRGRRKHSSPADDVIDRASTAAYWAAGYASKSKQLRWLRDRLRTHYAEFQTSSETRIRLARDQLADLFTDLVLIPLAGKTISQTATRELLHISGVERVLDNPYTGERAQPAAAQAFQELLPHLALTNLKRLVGASSMEQLEQARDDTKATVAFAAAYGAFLTNLKEPSTAFAWVIAGIMNITAIAYAIPAMVVIRSWRSQPLDEFLAAAHHWTPGFAAFAELLATLPDPLISDLKAEHGNPSEATKTEFRKHILGFATTHPDAYQIAVNVPPYEALT